MSLLDNGFVLHEFDYDTWIDNFSDTNVVADDLDLDSVVLHGQANELFELLKKDNRYGYIMAVLEKADQDSLYSWIVRPDTFPILIESPAFNSFLREFIPYFIMHKNKWTLDQVCVEFRRYLDSVGFRYGNSRTKKCSVCGTDVSDLFASVLTANHILDQLPVAVVCPHCFKTNYFELDF